MVWTLIKDISINQSLGGPGGSRLYWPKFSFQTHSSMTSANLGGWGYGQKCSNCWYWEGCWGVCWHADSIPAILHKCIALSILSTRFMWKRREASHFQEIWQDSLSFKKLAQDFNQLGENAELMVFVTSFTWKWHDSSSFLLAKRGSHLQGIEFLACMALKF